MEQHNLCLLFLDIMINKDPASNNIWNDILYKKHWYSEICSINSCHTTQCKNTIPFTLARRICTIVENSEVRKRRLNELQKVLCSQNYPQNLIQEVIRKATSIYIENLRASKAKTDSSNLAFVTTFNLNYKNVFPLIKTALSHCYNHMKQKKVSKILS